MKKIIKFSKSNNPTASYDGMKGKFSKYVEVGIVAFEVFLLFALAITSSVQLVGVYVVFASLILPALASLNFQNSYKLL